MEHKWAYFKKQEYDQFLRHFPVAKDVVEPLIEEKEELEALGVDLEAITDEQIDVLGDDAPN
jgi:hypothetical protein